MDYAIAGVESLVLEYDANGNLIYMCTAVAGGATSDPVWRIKRLTYDANGNLTRVEWADGNTQFDNVADDRASLSYS